MKIRKDKTTPPIPVTVVAGFLGAGKTTLVNHILKGDHGRKIAVVVNDFGSVNIDAELISDVGEGMVSLANGCICCVIRSDLISAVLKLADQPEPLDHILIESSGVADPASVVRAFMAPEILRSVLLDGVITLVGADQALDLLPDEEMKLAVAQVAGGDLIVLNKVDLVNGETLGRVRQWVEKIRPGVQILESDHGNLPLEILLGLEANDPVSPDQTPRVKGQILSSLPDTDQGLGQNHHHDQVFDTWYFESDSPLELGIFQQVVKHLPKTVYRSKGFVYTKEKPHRRLLLQLVGRRATIAVDGPWEELKPRTRLVFIAGFGTCNIPGIQKALNGCRVDHSRKQ